MLYLDKYILCKLRRELRAIVGKIIESQSG